MERKGRNDKKRLTLQLSAPESISNTMQSTRCPDTRPVPESGCDGFQRSFLYGLQSNIHTRKGLPSKCRNKYPVCRAMRTVPASRDHGPAPCGCGDFAILIREVLQKYNTHGVLRSCARQPMTGFPFRNGRRIGRRCHHFHRRSPIIVILNDNRRCHPERSEGSLFCAPEILRHCRSSE